MLKANQQRITLSTRQSRHSPPLPLENNNTPDGVQGARYGIKAFRSRYKLDGKATQARRRCRIAITDYLYLTILFVLHHLPF